MGEFNFLELEIEQPGVAWLWLNRPETLNALFPGMFSELQLCLDRLLTAGMRVVVLAGRGSHFCSGADLRWLRQAHGMTIEERQLQTEAFERLLDTLEALPCPLLGRVQGGTYGMGLPLLACCDQVIADDRCQFAFSEVRLGLSPALGMRKVLHRIGTAGARELMLSGAEFDTPHAIRLGLVNYAVSARDLDKVVENAVDEYLECAPQALASAKQLLVQVQPSDRGDMERSLAARVMGGTEALEGITAFSEDRLPYWDPHAGQGK